MSLFFKTLETISEQDIHSLIKLGIRESKVIDFKRKLPDDSDYSKKEFLADVSSFANSGGGDIIFGIGESGGLPIKLYGVRSKDMEQEILRLEHLILDGVEPRIYGTEVHPVLLSNGKYVVIVRIPRSWSAPHMVTYKAHSKFYTRNSSGKHPLDVSELKVAFSLTDTIITSMRAFRNERIHEIRSGSAAIPLSDTGKILLHIIPFSMSSPTSNIDIPLMEHHPHLPKSLFGSDIFHQRYNFDGFLLHTETSYMQVFRSGAIEFVVDEFLSHSKGKSSIPIDYERMVIDMVTDVLSLEKESNIEPPFLIMITILSVKGCFMGISSNYKWYDGQPIDRNDLSLPEIYIDAFDTNIQHALKPAFDTVWNAAGWPRSMNYSEEGGWIGQ
jgi:hypothetical protein